MKKTLIRQRVWLSRVKRRSQANLFFAGLPPTSGGPPANPSPPSNPDFYTLRVRQRPFVQRQQLSSVRLFKRRRNKTALYLHFAATKVLVAVPNVVDVAVASAMSVLSNAGLGSSETFKPSLTVPLGIVISQNPTSLMPPVLSGSIVALVISTGWDTVPDVGNKTLVAAVTAIVAAGLIPSINEVPLLGVPPGTVIAQQPLPQTRVFPGATVVIAVAKAPPPGTVRAQLPSVADLVAVQVNLQ